MHTAGETSDQGVVLMLHGQRAQGERSKKPPMTHVEVPWRLRHLSRRTGRLPRLASASRRLALALIVALTGPLLALGSNPASVALASGIATPVAFTCQNDNWQPYTVPSGFTELYVQAGGAEGGTTGTPGGKGGSVQAIVPVASGETVGVLVGCRGGDGDVQRAGSGGDGDGQGGNGGSSGLGEDGAGGGGGSAVTDSNRVVEYVVAGGGGGGGGNATVDFGHSGGRGGDDSQTGQNGHGGGGTGNPGGQGGGSATSDGEKGWGTAAGGAGGGGGGGYQGGAAGHGGGDAYSGGGGGGGGSSYVESGGTNVVYTRGNVSGDGYVVLVPMKPWSAQPSVQVVPCNNGAHVAYTVPAAVPFLNVLANGAKGSAGGARVQATVPVTAGEQLTAVAGCAATSTAAGKGYGDGGMGGGTNAQKLGDNQGNNGGGGSALLDASGKPLLVAGGGGGAGGGGTFTGGGSTGASGQTGANGSGGGGAAGGSGGAGGGLTSPNSPGGGSGTDSRLGGGGGGGGGGYNGGQGGGDGEVGDGGGGGGGGSSFAVATATNVTYEAGISGGNGYVVITAVPVSVPDAPTNVLVTTGVDQVTVAFQPPAADGGANITSYTVTASPGGATATGTGSPITVTGLTGTAPYTFTVRATNVIGSGPPSAPSIPVLAYTVPDVPAISSVAPGNGQATVAFTSRGTGGQPITSYTATARTGSPTATGPGVTASGTSSPLTITGLTNGTTYYVTVYATNLAGNSIESSPYGVLPSTVPGAPTNVTATLISGGVSVAFTPPTSTGGAPINSYMVTSSPGGITATGGQGPITVRGLTNGVTYTFTVVATNAAGSSPASAPSNPVTPQAFTIPSPPLLPNATPGDQQATVSFTTPLDNGGSPITSYTVTSNPGGISATGPASPITITGLTDGTSYTFTVVATNAAGNSQPSTVSNAVTPMPATIPSSPPAPVASARNQGALVSVTPPQSNGGSPITSYTVTSNPGGITATGSASPITITGLTDGTSYTFTAVATNAVGTSQPSPASNAVTPSASLAPANDNFANAQVITGSSGTVAGTNVNATTEAGEPGSGGASVWYAYTVPSGGGVLQIDTCGSSFTPAVVAYTGSSVTALTLLGSSTVGVYCGATGTTISGIQVALPPNGSTVYLAVDGGTPSSPVEGSFNLHWGQGGG